MFIDELFYLLEEVLFFFFHDDIYLMNIISCHFVLYFLGAKIVIIYDNYNNINLFFGISCIKKKILVAMLIFSVIFKV